MALKCRRSGLGLIDFFGQKKSPSPFALSSVSAGEVAMLSLPDGDALSVSVSSPPWRGYTAKGGGVYKAASVG